MAEFKCEFCKSIFSCKRSLKYHQKNAKYCLKIQGKDNATFTCTGCNKSFYRKFVYQRHIKKCKKTEKLVDQEKKITELTNLLSNKNFYISKLEMDIKKQSIIISNLQDKLENIAIKAVSRPTHTTSNKTIQINNYIKQMEPLRIDRIKENVPMLTLDHHVKGPEGYAEYALEFPFKDRIICVDVARNKIKYKNEEGDIVEDPGFRKMMLKLCDALKDRSYKLCQDHYEKLLDKFSEEEMDNTDFDFMEAAKAIHKYANGRESEFCSKIIRLISKGSKV
jgi:hypothetical protein